MKRIVGFIMAIILFSSLIYPCESMIKEKAELNHIVSVSQDIAKLCAEYDDYSELDDTDDKTIDTRLIVKTDDSIDEYGAIDSVYGFGYAFLQYADKESAQAAKAQYEESGYTADFDSVVTASATEDTELAWRAEWAYEETDAVSAIDYYKLKVKPNINIAVLDSGINYNHELFKNRLVRTKIDFSTENKDDEMDTFGHGTNVAGAIVKSTPSNVKISAYKFFDKNGKSTGTESLAALAYIKQLNNKPDIINCSFSSPSGLSSMISELTEMGITFVAAAGNDTKQVTTEFINNDETIVVAAFNHNLKPCSFTNYGSQVAISAPGEYVCTSDMAFNTKYVFVNGTSIATPIVSAACAYVIMEHKDYTPAQIKQELMATATPFKKGDCYNDRYGAGIVNFSNIINGSRCKDVTANYISGAYRDSISVELKCANTLVDIYYTTDGTMPTKTNGTKYTEPFDINESARVIAAAYARAGTPMHSKFTYLDYYILNDDESEYVIDNDGKIKAYLGNETNLVVPDIVNGIVPTELGKNLFENSNVESIVLPDTVETIGDNAFYNTPLKSITANGVRYLNKRCFYGCEQLAEINFPNLRHIATEAFFGCKSLTQDLELSSVERIADQGLAGTYFKTINLPECTKVGTSAFEGCAAQEIVLKKAPDLGSKAFYNCANLEIIYAPQTKWFGGCAGCTNLKTVFVPAANGITVDIPSNAKIYCNYWCTSIYFPKEYDAYKCTIVSPEYTAGLAAAIQDGDKDRYIHINSDDIAVSKGAKIRTSDNGLRFSFAFDDNSVGFDFAKYADTIDYGVVYTQTSFEGESDYQINCSFRVNNDKENRIRKADKRNINGTVSEYSAVLTDIPETYYDYKLSARAYVNIDGMYFYSPVTTASLNDVKEYGDDEAYDNDIQFEEHEHSYQRSVFRPDCENSGYTIYTCRVCKERYMNNFTAALGHNYIFTDYSDGIYSYECTYCNKTDSKSKNDLPEFNPYINTNVERGKENMYLDLDNNRFINAKDYAEIHHFAEWN